MSITYRSSTRAGGDGSFTLTINKPSGVVAGDLLIAAIAVDGLATLTAPSGWTLIRNTSGNVRVATYYRVAGSSEPTSYTWTLSSGNDSSGTIAAYTGTNTSAPIVTSAGSTGSSSPITAPSVTTTATGQRAVVVLTQGGVFGATIQAPSGTTSRSVYSSGVIHSAHNLADYEPASVGATGTKSGTTDQSGYTASQQIVIAPTPNQAPNAPTLTGPGNGSTLDRSIVQRFAWTFSDPDTGDSQSKFDLRYRLVGGATWTDVTDPTPNQFWDAPAATFPAGDYEWQVCTYDAQGEAGPYSGSSFFTAASAPPAPAITAPVSGATIASNSATVTWSAPNQTGYQLRRVADDAGNPDAATVYDDSGEVVSTSRSRSATFDTNDRYEHLQVRIKYDGLWSSWASIRVLVSYTPPPTPSLTLTASATTLQVAVTNPAPGAGEPAVTHNQIFVDDGEGEQFRAVIAANSTWTYWTPRSGIDYDPLVRVVAVGDNGTEASS